MFAEHQEWIVTLGVSAGGGYAKINAPYEEAREIAYKKFGQAQCSFFYPLNTSSEQQQQWLEKTGYPLQTAEEIIQKHGLKERVA